MNSAQRRGIYRRIARNFGIKPGAEVIAENGKTVTVQKITREGHAVLVKSANNRTMELHMPPACLGM